MTVTSISTAVTPTEIARLGVEVVNNPATAALFDSHTLFSSIVDGLGEDAKVQMVLEHGNVGHGDFHRLSLWANGITYSASTAPQVMDWAKPAPDSLLATKHQNAIPDLREAMVQTWEMATKQLHAAGQLGDEVSLKLTQQKVSKVMDRINDPDAWSAFRILQISPEHANTLDALDAAEGLRRLDFCDFTYVTWDNRVVSIMSCDNLSEHTPLVKGQTLIRLPVYTRNQE